MSVMRCFPEPGHTCNPHTFQVAGADGCCLLWHVVNESTEKFAFTAQMPSFGTEHKKRQLTIMFYWLNDSISNLLPWQW